MFTQLEGQDKDQWLHNSSAQALYAPPMASESPRSQGPPPTATVQFPPGPAAVRFPPGAQPAATASTGGVALPPQPQAPAAAFTQPPMTSTIAPQQSLVPPTAAPAAAPL